MRYWSNAGEGNHALALQKISGIPGGVFVKAPPADYIGRHSDEAAEARGKWLRWHDGSAVGSTPGFRHGGKAAP
jgi:hypothetical protein